MAHDATSESRFPSFSTSSIVASARVVAAIASQRAPQRDDDGSFPQEEIASLYENALLLAPFPESQGGFALGSTESSTLLLRQVLRTIGASSLSLGRLYEGHVNAVRLLIEYGNSRQLHELLDEARRARISGVWNAERPPGLHFDTGSRVLSGSKIYCSGAGFINRPLVTAASVDGMLMLLPDTSTAQVDVSNWKPTGMRASLTGTINFDRVRCESGSIVGSPGDYYRAPLFSTGAWRVLAVQLGALDKLLSLFREGLLQRNRQTDPLQRARFGQAYAKLETARLWTARAASIAEKQSLSHGERESFVNLARGAFERCALDIIELIQRSLGLSTMIHPNPIERISRDLLTYLRQPFPDGALDASAEWLIHHQLDIHTDFGER